MLHLPPVHFQRCAGSDKPVSLFYNYTLVHVIWTMVPPLWEAHCTNNESPPISQPTNDYGTHLQLPTEQGCPNFLTSRFKKSTVFLMYCVWIQKICNNQQLKRSKRTKNWLYLLLLLLLFLNYKWVRLLGIECTKLLSCNRKLKIYVQESALREVGYACLFIPRFFSDPLVECQDVFTRPTTISFHLQFKICQIFLQNLLFHCVKSL